MRYRQTATDENERTVPTDGSESGLTPAVADVFK